MTALIWFLGGAGVGYALGQAILLLLDIKKHGWHNDR